jgi:hypothetical protein
VCACLGLKGLLLLPIAHSYYIELLITVKRFYCLFPNKFMYIGMCTELNSEYFSALKVLHVRNECMYVCCPIRSRYKCERLYLIQYLDTKHLLTVLV